MLYNSGLASAYINVISKQLDNIRGRFSTIYIGGGTPTVLDTNLLKILLKRLQSITDKFSEFTIEANPESVNAEKIIILLDNGVNRISIGVQSFNNVKLKALGRIHDSLSAKEAVELAHKNGFKNISIDLISGVREESFEDWKKDLRQAVSLPVKHISCYSLDYKKLEAGEEDAAKMYEYAVDYLSGKGFRQYEISNFAKDGYRCLHNLTYWDNDPYIGLGPSAVSYMDGRREENIADVGDYMRSVESTGSAILSGEKLNEINRAKETAAVKIRTMDGIDSEWFKKKTGYDLLSLEKTALPKLLENGLIEYIKGKHLFKGVRLSRKGILFCDVVSSAFL